MTADEFNLGGHVATHRAAGGFTGFQNSPFGRMLFLTLTGVALGFIPGLIVALIADMAVALIVFPVIGGAIAYAWARRNRFEFAVTEARLHERGVVFVDGRGTHELAWGDVAAMEGRRIQNVASTPLMDIKGVINSTYVVATRDGRRFLLDDRIENITGLADTVARASGVAITRMG